MHPEKFIGLRDNVVAPFTGLLLSIVIVGLRLPRTSYLILIFENPNLMCTGTTFYGTRVRETPKSGAGIVFWTNSSQWTAVT